MQSDTIGTRHRWTFQLVRTVALLVFGGFVSHAEPLRVHVADPLAGVLSAGCHGEAHSSPACYA